MGLRLDVLLRAKTSSQRKVIAHEMAHERQQFCTIPHGQARWPDNAFRRVREAEDEADREVSCFLKEENRPLAAFANRVGSMMRVPAAAVLAQPWLRRLLGITLIALYIWASYQAIQTILNFIPPWSNKHAFAGLVLYGFVNVIILYRFARGVSLSRFYAKEIGDEAH